MYLLLSITSFFLEKVLLARTVERRSYCCVRRTRTGDSDELPHGRRRPFHYYASLVVVVAVTMELLRRFELVRTEDASGISGTGVVAVGVEFPDGAVVLQWLNERNNDVQTERNGLALYPSRSGVEDALEVHGHSGGTEVRFLD